MSSVESAIPSVDDVLSARAYAPSLQAMLRCYGLSVRWLEAGESIPGSFWGDSEAGLIADVLNLRQDTPLHSALHEACHYVCMDADRRAGLHTDAGGDYDEENAVCYLQILLADELPAAGGARLMEDMDRWGYSFRLGSARTWFEQDATDARAWLLSHGVINAVGRPSFRLRR